MAITGDVQIKVDSTVLKAKADSVSDSIRQMEEGFDRLETIINRTSYYWIGEAGELHRNMYKEQKEQIEEMMRRLKEHPKDLVTIAQTYDTAEAEIQVIAAELPGDVIS